jgi:hypothetical protein
MDVKLWGGEGKGREKGVSSRLHNKKAKKPLKTNRDQENKTQKWFSFKCSGTEVLSISRYLKKQNINIAFRTSNTLGRYLRKRFAKVQIVNY